MAPKSASYLQAQFYRLRALRGAKKPICALAASILTIIYHVHMGIGGELYLGLDQFDRRTKAAQTSRFVTRWQNLGHAAQISPSLARPLLFRAGTVRRCASRSKERSWPQNRRESGEFETRGTPNEFWYRASHAGGFLEDRKAR
jgi:hypothetical protein